MMERMRLGGVSPLVVAALLLWSAVPAAAQTVLGRVLEGGGGGPVVGAMVRLHTEIGYTGTGWLTAVDGRFRLAAPAPGTYQISVERIGFASTVVEGITLVENGIVSMDVVVEATPISLEGLDVEAEGGRCSADFSGGSGAQRLWDEARKALSAASWTDAQGSLRFVASVWDRQISPRTSQILYEEREERETFGANSVQSLPPDELVRDGYVHRDPAYFYYYAPDADVLLSEEFQSTHCFRVVESDDDGSPLLGLGFVPNDDRDLPDVEGVIWLDAGTGRLDHLAFKYTGLDIAGADRARGEVRWAELDNGLWIVREWFIQAPMARGLVGMPGALRRASRGTIHEVGNEVQLVEGDGFTWRPDTQLGILRGLVYDSVSSAPLAGAEVRIAGRPLRAQTDLTGRFELHSVPPGLHRLTFSHEDLDSIGITPGWVTAEMAPGGEGDVILTVPTWETLLARSCGQGGAGAVVGVVRTRTGSVVPGATVEALGVRGDDGLPATARSDRRGAYVLCGLPGGVTRVTAQRGGAESEPSEVRTDSERLVQADLTLAPRPPPAPVVPGVLRPALIGSVSAAGSGRPLSDVIIDLLDENGDALASTLTDSEGTFRVVLQEGTRVYLSISRLGYREAVSEAVDVLEGTRRIEITLPEEAIELPPVVVIVEGRVPQLEREGFYARALASPGMFIRQDDVEAVSPARTSDLLGRAPGVRVTTNPLEGDFRRRIIFNRLTLVGGDKCYPSVFIDGDLARAGGSRAEAEAPAIEGIETPVDEDVPSLDELVPPREILAVEMYENPGQVPRRFVGLGTHCGVIVVWTTRGRGGN